MESMVGDQVKGSLRRLITYCDFVKATMPDQRLNVTRSLCLRDLVAFVEDYVGHNDM